MRSFDDALLHKAGQEFETALVHMKRLLRLRNFLCSPLLRLPTEIIIRILSFVMAGLDSWPCRGIWESIYNTCHYILRIMRSATELWWKVDYESTGPAQYIFARSKGDPQFIFSDLRSMVDERLSPIEMVLDH